MLLRAYQGDAAAAEVFLLTGGTVLLLAEPHLDAEANPAIAIDGHPAGRRQAKSTLALADGRTASVLAFALPDPGCAGGVVTLSIDGDEVIRSDDAWHGSGELERLFERLAPAGRLRLFRFILETCRSTFGLGASPAFATACSALLRRLVPRPTTLRALGRVGGELSLWQGRLPAGFGVIASTLVIGAEGVRRNPFGADCPAPARHRPSSFDVMLQGAGTETVVVIGASGIAWSVAAAGACDEEYFQLAARQPPSVATRAYVHRCLSPLAETDALAAALRRDLQLLSPLPVRTLDATQGPLAATFERCIGAGGGMFVSGWLRDPLAMVAGIEFSGYDAVHPVPNERLYRFAHEVMPTSGAPIPSGAEAFIGFLPAADDGTLQPRLRLSLASGAAVELVPPLMTWTARSAREAVLSSVPARRLRPEMLEAAIVPAAAALHKAVLAEQVPPRVTEIGRQPKHPAISAVIPLYRNYGFLRHQLASFAIDPAFAEIELVFVLDSPEDHDEVLHLLRGLEAAFGRPLTLVTMSANFGYAAANNTGARIARGEVLLLLNSDVVPTQPCWVETLNAALGADPSVAAAGAKLLFDDGSIQHAGMFFGRDVAGEWLNMHFYKGYPRDFPAANEPRAVPAITGAAVAIHRAAFAAVGGFTEDYIIGDYEDSDLCLKLARAGYRIVYEPRAELYHFERRSIVRHTGYTESVASEYNRRLHRLRWHDEMARIMAPAPARRAASRSKRKSA